MCSCKLVENASVLSMFTLIDMTKAAVQSSLRSKLHVGTSVCVCVLSCVYSKIVGLPCLRSESLPFTCCHVITIHISLENSTLIMIAHMYPQWPGQPPDIWDTVIWAAQSRKSSLTHKVNWIDFLSFLARNPGIH